MAQTEIQKAKIAILEEAVKMAEIEALEVDVDDYSKGYSEGAKAVGRKLKAMILRITSE